MAQLNMRIPDADKEAAEEVARSAGFSLGEYLGTLVSYMSVHRTLPVLIKFKPVAIRPEEAFQQAIVKFRNAYLLVSHLCSSVLVEGEMTPLEALREPIKDIDAAQAFYESHESLIALAPGQLERLDISDSEHAMFARCREHFPYIPGFLRTAIRMVNINNRPVQAKDLVEMREALQQAANQINILQSMVECEVSGDARRAFFLRDVEEAVWCAMKSTRPGEAYMVRVAWRDRMDNHIRQAEVEFQSLGVVPYLDDLVVIWEKLRAVGGAVHGYLEHVSEPMQGFDVRNIDDLKESLAIVKQLISPPENA